MESCKEKYLFGRRNVLFVEMKDESDLSKYDAKYDASADANNGNDKKKENFKIWKLAMQFFPFTSFGPNFSIVCQFTYIIYVSLRSPIICKYSVKKINHV